MNFIYGLWAIINEMAPYLLLGFFIAGLLKVIIPHNWTKKYLGKSDTQSVVNATLLGIPIPLCSCGVIPTGVSLHKNGASKGASVSFLISTPQTGVDSIMITYSMIGLPFAIIRVIAALVSGLLGGFMTNVFNKDVQTQHSISKEIKKLKNQMNPIFKVFHYGFYEFLMDIAKWLIIGILIAAFISFILPDDFFTMYLSNSFLSMFLTLIASIPLYICATASVPIAAVLMMKGLSPGAALVFLMAGPATNMATITVIRNVFGNKTLFIYLGAIIVGAISFGTLINTVFPSEWFIISGMHHHEHEIIPQWLSIASSILLIGLIINGYILNYLKSRRKIDVKKVNSTVDTNSVISNNFKPNFADFTTITMEKTVLLQVEGMTCSHCKNSVEQNVGKLDGITSVLAEPSANRVTVKGNNPNISKIREIIEGLGYRVK